MGVAAVHVIAAVGAGVARGEPHGHSRGDANRAGHSCEGSRELLAKSATHSQEVLDGVVAVAALHGEVVDELAAEPVLQGQRFVVSTGAGSGDFEGCLCYGLGEVVRQTDRWVAVWQRFWCGAKQRSGHVSDTRNNCVVGPLLQPDARNHKRAGRVDPVGLAVLQADSAIRGGQQVAAKRRNVDLLHHIV